VKLTFFCLIYIFFPPILTMMHLCIMLYTYWTLLHTSMAYIHSYVLTDMTYMHNKHNVLTDVTYRWTRADIHSCRYV